MKFLIATGNAHKLQEILDILPRQNKAGELFEYVSLHDIPGLALPEETGTTLEENARLKAQYAAAQSGLPTLSDDTGLEVDFLNGQPGVHTARYAGEPADTDANNHKLLNVLGDIPLAKRTARFRTVACLSLPGGKTFYYEGILKGAIGFGYRGENGFGYDPIFLVEGTHKTLAEMTEAEKNTISHRGKAFRKLAADLQNFPK